MQKQLYYYVSLILLAFFFFSCNLKNTIILEGQGRGQMTLSLKLPSYMLDSIDILAASIPGGDELLKPETIAKDLRRTDDISDVVVKSSQKGAYNISFRFQNFDQKTTAGAKDFFQWSKEANGATRLSITVNRQTYQQLEQQFPAMRDNPLVQLYGPASTQGMSRTDYLDMVEYSFNNQARKDFPEAEAVILIQVPRQVISQVGGVKKTANTVEFRLPLLDFALLNQAKHYSLVYR